MALGIDDKEKKPGGLPAAPNQLGAGPNQMGAGPAPLSQPPQQKKATGFVNLNKYMQANVGNKLGQAVGGGISGQAQQARTGLQEQQGQFQQQSQQGRVGTAQDVQQMQGVLQDPTKASDADVAAFQKFRTQGYVGPQGLQNTEQLQSQAQQAQQLGGAVGSTGGRLGLLQRFLGGGQQYGGGQQKMDEMLLGRSAGQQLRDARRLSTQTSGDIERGIGQASEIGQNLRNEAEAFKGLVTNKIGEQETGVQTDLGGRMKTAESDRSKRFDDLKDALKSGEITAEDAKALGLSEGQDLYNVDASRFLNADTTAASMQNVAKAQEIAKMNALAKLGGHQQFGDESQAESFYKNQFNIDPKLQEAVSAAKSGYESAISPLRAGEAAYQGANQMLANYEKNAQIQNQMRALGERPDSLFTNPLGDESNNYTAEQMQASQNAQREYDTKYNALQSQITSNPADYGGLWGLINSVGRGGDEGTAKAFDIYMGDNQRQKAAELLRNVTGSAHSSYGQVQNQYSPERKLRFKQATKMMNPGIKSPLGGVDG